MRATVSAMEKSRIEYRAALSWMKSTSSQLDPDTGRGLDNFRKAQRQVRESKKLFDKLTLDVLEKIDLLAAARCNMFSHVLSSYQSAFLNFGTKVSHTMVATADSMNATPQYEFSILKELSQNLEESDEMGNAKLIAQEDKDQMLFFQDEYKDEKSEEKQKGNGDIANKDNVNPSHSAKNIESDAVSSSLIDTNPTEPDVSSDQSCNIGDLEGLRMDCGDAPQPHPGFGSFLPSQLLQDMKTMNLLEGPSASNNIINKELKPVTQESKPIMVTPKKEDKAAWFKLFAELDPLANPDNLPGSNSNQSHAA